MLAKRDKDHIVATPDKFIRLIEDASEGDLTYSAIGNYKVTDPLLVEYGDINAKNDSNIIFINCDFDELILKDIRIQCCHFIDIRVKKLKLVNCSISNCVFAACIIDKIEIDSSGIFSNTISKCDIGGGYIERCAIEENMITNFDIQGDGIFSHTCIIDNHIIDCYGNLAFMNCSIKKNKLRELFMKDLYFYKCEALNNITSRCSLDGMKSYESTVILNDVCPEEGSFIGYKKVWHINDSSWMALPMLPNSKITEYIAVLEIPEDAKRSSGGSDKCRADKVKVLRIEDMDGNEVKDAVGYSIIGLQSFSFTTMSGAYGTTVPQQIPTCKYKVGEMIYADSFDENKFNTCSNGIHFFISKDRAKEFNN